MDLLERKAERILTEIVAPYNKRFRKNPLMVEAFIGNAIDLNVTRLVEVTMAEVAKIKFIDGSHKDFNDGTECKTAVIREATPKKSPGIHRIQITNVRSRQSGELKSGDIRVVLYNPFLDRCEYFYIPNEALDNDIKVSKSNCHVAVSYNRSSGLIAKLEKYRVCDFKTLCKMTPKKKKKA